jgi:hypothetical protein
MRSIVFETAITSYNLLFRLVIGKAFALVGSMNKRLMDDISRQVFAICERRKVRQSVNNKILVSYFQGCVIVESEY